MRFHRGYMVGFLLLAIIVIAVPLTVVIAQKIQQAAGGGNALYVSPSGRDSNPGTQTAPFATIEKADSVATPGTTVHVLPGIYTWNGVYTTHSGTATAPITFISDSKWGAILKPSSLSSYSATCIWDAGGSYVDISRFDFDGSLVSSGEGLCMAVPNIRALGNRVHDIIKGNGISTNGYTGPDDAIGNLIFNIGTPSVVTNQIHGIYFEVANGGHIQNNIIWGVSGYGIHCWHACANTIISNNTVFNNRTGGIIFGGGDSPNYGSSLCDNMIVSNNIAINNADTGIREYEYPGQYTIGTHNQILNNIVYGNPDGDMVLLEGNTASDTITSNAQFVKYRQDGSGDYHLRSTSPAIDAGTSVGAPSTDFAGNPRPQGKGYDIGAYEYSVHPIS